MAIQYIVEPKLISPSGLSLTNPISVIATKDPSDLDKFAELKLYNRNNVLFATLRSTFVIDKFNNHIAVFEISEIIKSLFERELNFIATSTQYNTPYFGLVVSYPSYDTTQLFTSFYTEIGTDKRKHYCVSAGLENYDVYYIFSPGAVENFQSDFFVHTILPDDIGFPTIFAVDFDETDFDETDFN